MQISGTTKPLAPALNDVSALLCSN